MKVTVTKEMTYPTYTEGGEVRYTFATTENGTKLVFCTETYNNWKSFQRKVAPEEALEFYCKYDSHYENSLPLSRLPSAVTIKDEEGTITSDVITEADIRISDYEFKDVTIGWNPGDEIKNEFRDRFTGIYNEIGSAYDLEQIGTFDEYCPDKYKAMLESEDYTDEQKELIRKVAKLRAYSNIQHSFDEHIDDIVNGNAIITSEETYNQGRSLCFMALYTVDDIKAANLDNFTMWFDTRLRLDRAHPGESAWQFNDNRSYPQIWSMTEKQVDLPNGEKYRGTLFSNFGPWDVCVDQNGEMDLRNNPFIGVDRFDLETGEELTGYNEQIAEEKRARREFYNSVMEDIQETFGLSREQAKILLKYAGTVTALKDVAELGRIGVSGKELRAIARKISYEGVHSVSERVSNVFTGRLDTFQDAAETLQYLDYLLGGEKERDRIVKEHSLSEVEKLNLGESEISGVIAETGRIQEGEGQIK